MSGYAPNPTAPENAAASLTSSLLARKGQATPAVDAVVHEGVDVDLNTNFAARPRRRVVDEDAIETLYPEGPQSDRQDAPLPPADPEAHRWNGVEHRRRPAITLDAAPENWTITSDGAPARPQLRQRAPRDDAGQMRAKEGALRATVKFRMPATDFIRLRAASRAMRESCQIIIVDAIAAYLDANEVDPIDEETARREAARLSRSRRSG